MEQAISAIEGDSGLSQVIPVSADYGIAKLDKRYPGEPVALPVVRDRLESMLKAAAQAEARKDMVRRLEQKGLVTYLPGAAQYGKIAAGSAADQATTATDQTTTVPE
jgi:hypothetical protein